MKTPIANSGRGLFLLVGCWSEMVFLSASSQIAIRLSGKGIWFQTSANPIPHFIDLRGYCGVHAEKMKNVLFP